MSCRTVSSRSARCTTPAAISRQSSASMSSGQMADRPALLVLVAIGAVGHAGVADMPVGRRETPLHLLRPELDQPPDERRATPPSGLSIRADELVRHTRQRPVARDDLRRAPKSPAMVRGDCPPVLVIRLRAPRHAIRRPVSAQLSSLRRRSSVRGNSVWVLPAEYRERAGAYGRCASKRREAPRLRLEGVDGEGIVACGRRGCAT